MNRRVHFPALLAAILFSAIQAGAKIELASPFTDHMVLQREVSVPVWGTASQNAKVTVRFQEKTYGANADADGHWKVMLPSMEAGGPYEMTVQENGSRVDLKDILIGEVWLCSGQSNMDFTVAKTEKYYFAGVNNEAAEVAAANYPKIRMFTPELQMKYEPQQRVNGQWKICNPENVREFSAIGYFFARDLQKELNVPVGILTLTYGASTAQAWVRREAIEANPKLKPTLDGFDDVVKKFRADPSIAEKYKAAQEKFKAAAATRAPGERAPRGPRNPDPVNDQHNPTVLFNGKIAPVIPYAIRGILWYQGESIVGPRELFPIWNETLIKDWRGLWGSELPFFFCQLAAIHAPPTEPGDSGLATVRALQEEALKLPNTGMALTIDIGDEKNVHPKDKQDVGDRLTRIALAKVYKKDVVASGPTFDSVEAANHVLRVKFANLGGGLVARGGPLKQFAVAGSDKKFVWADAKIDGDTVIVGSEKVAEPHYVQYAWADNPVGCNLYNTAGLPAVPFRAEIGGRTKATAEGK